MKNGVYQIRNLFNGKRYIGSAAERRGISQRWSVHKAMLKRGIHHSPHLQNAWNKYGTDAFVFAILLYCDPVNCIMYEQIAMDCYKPEYNILPQAGSCRGRVITTETCRKISMSLLGNQNWLGKKHSNITIEKMRKIQRGENNPSSKLTEGDVLKIKGLLNDGITQHQIAQQFSVGRTTISHIKNKKYWSWV